MDGASGELLVVSVVGLSPEDGPRQVEVGRRQIPNHDHDEREQGNEPAPIANTLSLRGVFISAP